MLDSLALLQELLPELATYCQTAQAPQLNDFAAWLHRRTNAPTATAQLPPQEPAFLNRLSPFVQLGPLVARVQHFSQLRAQQLLAAVQPITSQRDFVVLAFIVNSRTPTKSEIANNSLLELSTITEVTRRLTQAGLVVEVADAQDRRTRRLQATPAGQALFSVATAQMQQLHPYIYEPLSVPEQTELHRLLSIVNAYLTREFGQREE